MNHASTIVRVSLITLLAGVAGCSTLPRSGPDHRNVEKTAAVRVGLKEQKVGIDYVLLDLNSFALPYFEETKKSKLTDGFGGGKGGAPELPLGIGDVVQITIFESASGGLFIPADAGSRAGNFVTLPNQTIDRSGTITVPYAGRIKASGRKTEAVQAEIESLLSNRAIEPQAVITIVSRQSSEISVLGDVAAPAKFQINPNGERVLDAIAQAGGLKTAGAETFITLQRRGKEGTVLFNDLIDHPEENIYVAPGDTIYANRQRRTFLAFGASGLNGRLDFEESGLSLGDALGKAGGLLDARADPAQLLLYRQVDRSILKKMNVDVTRFAGNAVPVIFRANLRDPSGFFAIQKFAMVDKDILYVSNSESTELEKFLNIVTQVTGAGANVTGDFANGRSSVRDVVY